jgi:hypothetical protein
VADSAVWVAREDGRSLGEMERSTERTGGESQPPVLDGLRLEEWVGTDRKASHGPRERPF